MLTPEVLDDWLLLEADPELVLLFEFKFVLELEFMFELLFALHILLDSEYPDTQPMHTKFVVKDWQFAGIWEVSPNSCKKYITPSLLISNSSEPPPLFELVLETVLETEGVELVVVIVDVVLEVGVLLGFFTTIVCPELLEDNPEDEDEDDVMVVVVPLDEAVWVPVLPKAWKLPDDELDDPAFALFSLKAVLLTQLLATIVKPVEQLLHLKLVSW